MPNTKDLIEAFRNGTSNATSRHPQMRIVGDKFRDEICPGQRRFHVTAARCVQHPPAWSS
jgi:hypothetical protein